ncbi:hypothetical protein CABS03_15150 [Colletotrichum abscissum]|uniref:Uncharacterized protein n=1 Tax=Colletotrichum abscissum TaxID=1671311 RepID=A0A9Q0AWW5_9PEZI|nr:hypothetical protein CABS02_14433 [Colletotrichum abscissum]
MMSHQDRPSFQHVRIHRQCGACGFLFGIGDHLVAPHSHLRKLAKLPPELTTMIWGYLGQHALLRLCCVLETIDFAHRKGLDTPLLGPLRQVQFWQRGKLPIIATSGLSKPLQMTIDSRGIRCIERSGCSTAQLRSTFDLYTTVDAENDFTISFQFGVGRLATPPRPATLQLTDTPNLSPKAGFQFPSPKHGDRLATVDLDHCSGITFFLLKRDLLAIHAHTPTAPTADTTFAQIESTIQPSLSWFYVPNPPRDKISALGVRIGTKEGEPQLNQRTYLVRTPHRGGFYIGPPPTGPGQQHAVLTTSRSTLLSVVARNKSVVIRGVLREGGPCSVVVPPAPENPPFPDACHALAKLSCVKSIWIFRDEESRFCRGLIVEYHDGTEKVLGQCRVGVDLAERCGAVEQFSFKVVRRQERPGKRMAMVMVMVRSSRSQGNDACDDGQWTVCSHEDTLEVWATATQMVMTITKLTDSNSPDTRVNVLSD